MLRKRTDDIRGEGIPEILCHIHHGLRECTGVDEEGVCSISPVHLSAGIFIKMPIAPDGRHCR